MQYQCELIDGELVKERFFRNGETIDQVKDELDLFQWPRGEWRIEPNFEA